MRRRRLARGVKAGGDIFVEAETAIAAACVVYRDALVLRDVHSSDGKEGEAGGGERGRGLKNTRNT